MATRTKSQPMCIITIGFQNLLLPISDGMKVVQLLSQAIDCEQQYEGGGEFTYVVHEQVDVGLKTVQPRQIREIDRTSPARPLLLLEKE